MSFSGGNDPFAGMLVEDFLDRLPTLATIVCGGVRLKNKPDQVLEAWAWGIEDTAATVSRMIVNWRKANAADPAFPTTTNGVNP
jgi:hypothetical protein